MDKKEKKIKLTGSRKFFKELDKSLENEAKNKKPLINKEFKDYEKEIASNNKPYSELSLSTLQKAVNEMSKIKERKPFIFYTFAGMKNMDYLEDVEDFKSLQDSEELERCKNDVIYYTEKYIFKRELTDSEKNMVKTYHKEGKHLMISRGRRGEKFIHLNA